MNIDNKKRSNNCEILLRKFNSKLSRLVGKSMANIHSKLSKIRIQGYKSLKNIEFSLHDFNIVIGENSTGKTTILQAIFDFLNSKNLTSDFENKISVSHPKEEILLEFHFEGKHDIASKLTIPDEDKPIDIRIYITNPVFRFIIQKHSGIGLIKFKEREIVIEELTGSNPQIHKSDMSNYYDKKIYKSREYDWFLIPTNNEESKLLAQRKISILSYISQFLGNLLHKEYKQFFTKVRNRESMPAFPHQYNPSIQFVYGKNIEIVYNFNFMKFQKSLLLSASREITRRKIKLNEQMPRTWEQRSTSGGLLSYFFYYSQETLKEKMSEILTWADTFGLKNLTSTLEEGYRTYLQFHDKKFNSMINIADSGLGTGQLLYVIVECILAEPGTVILIDEPEVHLHAKFQALLVDLFIETIQRGIQIILSTHSEYLILRLQRRISESKISEQQAIVLETFLEDDKGVKIEELRFNKEGHYLDKTPSVIDFAQKEFQQWAKNVQNNQDD